MTDEPGRIDQVPTSDAGDKTEDTALEGRWDRIEGEMRSARFWLSKQGSVVLKGHGGQHFWVLRFRAVLGGRRRQGTIFIGGVHDHELLRRARALLNSYRTEAEILRYMGTCLRLAARAGRDARRSAEDESIG
jgi:hypothetical protein